MLPSIIAFFLESVADFIEASQQEYLMFSIILFLFKVAQQPTLFLMGKS